MNARIRLQQILLCICNAGHIKIAVKKIKLTPNANHNKNHENTLNMCVRTRYYEPTQKFVIIKPRNTTKTYETQHNTVGIGGAAGKMKTLEDEIGAATGMERHCWDGRREYLERMGLKPTKITKTMQCVTGLADAGRRNETLA